jgi:DNA-binding NarL/FixJ family response regulator
VRVLVIDDSEPVRKRLCEAIKEVAGVTEVRECHLPEAAVIAISEFHPDLAVIELNKMNGLGFEQIADWKSRFPKTLLAVFTQYILPKYREHSELSGVDYFFLKARDFEFLIQTVGELAIRLRQPDSNLPTPNE